MSKKSKLDWVATRLKEVRESRGLSQVQLADRSREKMSRTRVAEYENQYTNPTLTHFLCLLDALNISPSDFFAAMPIILEPGSPKRKREYIPVQKPVEKKSPAKKSK